MEVESRLGALAVRLISPVVYAATLVPAVIWTVVLFLSLDALVVAFWPGWSSDTGAASATIATTSFLLTSFLGSATIFGMVGRWLFLLERLQRPGLWHHFRRSALLYAAFALSGTLLLLAIYQDEADKGYILVMLAVLSAGWAVLTDAWLLWRARLTYTRPAGRGT